MKIIIDTHAHVVKESYGDELFNVIKEMQDKNVIAYNIGTNIESSREIIKLNEEFESLIPVIGVHPSDADEWSEEISNEIQSLINDKVAAIGEIGLDYHYEGYDEEKQKKAFIEQIEIAIKYELPIVVHTRDSLEDCYDIVKNYPNQKFLFHSWSGDVEMTEKYLSISDNIYFSYNGIITFKNAELQNEVIKHIPIEKLLFETDCPYLTPTPFRGQTNYPWMTEEVIKYVADLFEMTFEEMNTINMKNTNSFYKN